MVIHGFETSNNMKVRVALGFKGIPYEFRTIDPTDRAEISRISGQHLTPVMVHEASVLFDSAAILRYLESNFPDTPRLFGRSLFEQWKIEDWELFARAILAGPLMHVVHRKVGGETIGAKTIQEADRELATAVERLRARMDGREWLVGESMSAADVTAAAVIYRIRESDLLTLPDPAADLNPWVDAVMRYDGIGRS